MMKPGILNGYMLINEDLEDKSKYEIGKSLEAEVTTLATLYWCTSNWQAGDKILGFEFEADDIIDLGVSNNDMRVSSCEVVEEVDLQMLAGYLNGYSGFSDND